MRPDSAGSVSVSMGMPRRSLSFLTSSIASRASLAACDFLLILRPLLLRAIALDGEDAGEREERNKHKSEEGGALGSPVDFSHMASLAPNMRIRMRRTTTEAVMSEQNDSITPRLSSHTAIKPGMMKPTTACSPHSAPPCAWMK